MGKTYDQKIEEWKNQAVIDPDAKRIKDRLNELNQKESDIESSIEDLQWELEQVKDEIEELEKEFSDKFE